MNWLQEHAVGLLILIVNVLYTTLRPIYMKWQKDRKLNLRRHGVFLQFESAQDEIEKMFYRSKNPIRAQNMKLFAEESNKYLLEFCLFVINKRNFSLSTEDFDFAIREALNSKTNKFKVFTQEAFDPIVRLKFGEYLLENQDIMVQYIQMYAAENGLTNKQKIWLMLTVVQTYLKRIPKILQTINTLNGDLDAYERKLLQKNVT
jgi:hypothetical protein